MKTIRRLSSCSTSDARRSALYAARRCGPERSRRAPDKFCGGGSRCVACEDEVASSGEVVAGKARFQQCLVAGFAVFEMTESPAARRGVSTRVLDHELDVRGRPRDEGL